ncbi:hypothetical protein EYC80_009252 [Monilinia laxa]|uniref:Peptidase S33 tripeptidyl aminopeptidase-like C-terminal domain-containing protein n=1 Tax=Monilinia laxa TaxID=61186 RepID=A0A5N6JXG0_MONLA|nr:hypothetical protein EYC80_009252 [Monilinia laxa]
MNYYIITIHTLAVLLISFTATSASPSNIKTGNLTKQWTFDEIPTSTNLILYPCFSRYHCFMLDVPLDYSKPNGTRASVPLIMIAAHSNSNDGPYQGMILTNPGGPGNSGVNFLLEDGYSVLLPVMGTNYDIVSFDPRGMGHSNPLADCSSSSPTKLHRRNFGLSGPEFDSSYWTKEFQTALDFGAQCNETIGGSDQAGHHMSTAVVAKDMLSIVDAFAKTERGQSVESSSLLNYWGFSYGSFIGETFASMYPNRVGRFVIDGVVDPEDYSSGVELNDIYLEDAIIDSFFTYCHLAGPSLCDFYTVYTPITSFATLATRLVAYETSLQKLTVAAIEAASNIGNTPSNIAGTIPELLEWFPAAFCGEIPSIYGTTHEELKSHIDMIKKQSFLGGEIWATSLVVCTGWPIIATLKFSGAFGGDTKNPVLLVSNTLDPATPIKNRKTWAPKFKDARLLTIEAIGHTSLAANNSCANHKIRHFLQTGNLPGHDSRCVVEAGPFRVTPLSFVVGADW